MSYGGLKQPHIQTSDRWSVKPTHSDQGGNQRQLSVKVNFTSREVDWSDHHCELLPLRRHFSADHINSPTLFRALQSPPPSPPTPYSPATGGPSCPNMGSGILRCLHCPVVCTQPVWFHPMSILGKYLLLWVMSHMLRRLVAVTADVFLGIFRPLCHKRMFLPCAISMKFFSRNLCCLSVWKKKWL